MNIPVIDFASCAVDKPDIQQSDLEDVGKAIYEAFMSVGFVYLKNTGIKREEIERVNRKTAQFFGLEEEVKQKYAIDKLYHGYIGFKVEGPNPERPGDLKEAYNVIGSSISSSTFLLPDDVVPDFSSTMKRFCGICKLLSDRIIQILSIAMKIKDTDYLIRCHSRINGERNYTTLRSVHYPPIPDDVALEPGQIRLGEHSDCGSFTLLFQDDVGGLEIEDHDGNYLEAVPIPDTVVVNIGDILQFWTKGRLRSTKHRILIPEDEIRRRSNRRSLAYFVHPNNEVLLEDIEYEASDDNIHQSTINGSRDAQPVTAMEHVNMTLQKTHH